MAWNTNLEAEKSVLGAMLQDAEAAQLARTELNRKDFFGAVHQELFSAMAQVLAEKKPLDLITLDAELNRRGKLEAVGGLDYLIDLTQFVPTTANTRAYIRILKEVRSRRDFAALSEHIKKAAEGDEFDAAKLTEKIRLYLKSLATASEEDTTITEVLMELYDAVFEKPDKSKGIMMGIPGLDRLTNGYKPSRLYVIGARPSVGKTAFATVTALRCAQAGKPVLYINQEMEKVDLLKRMLTTLSDVRMEEMERGEVPESKWENATDMITLMGSYKIHIANLSRTPAEIRAKALEIYEREGLGMVIIDYLQRMSPDGKFRSRDEEIGSMSKAIKNLAMELKIPVLLLSQLNRSATNERPHMGHLRESGNIEQDADVVILLHEPNLEDVPQNRRAARAAVYKQGGRYLELITDKNRFGNCDIVGTAFYGSKMRYVEIGV